MASFTTTDSENEITLALKPVMDLTVAEDLRLSFLDCLASGKAINIMANDVERITTPCLQVLLAMKNKTSELDINFSIAEMSEAFHDALKDIGLDDQFTILEHKE